MEEQTPMDHAEAVRTLAAERYLLGEMTAGEREAFEAHFFDCQTCAEAVDSGAVIADAARDPQAWTGATIQPFPARRGPRFATFIPLAAAAALALVAGYQSLVTIPALRRAAESPRALTPVALAPISRGEGATVNHPADDEPIALALDINAATPATNLVYDLRTSEGDVILTGQASAPPEGTPLLLIVPGTSLSSGQYALVVREGASPAREVGTYRFTVR